MGGMPLDRIIGEDIAAYVARRRHQGLQTASINAELRVLRRMLRLAVEWGKAEKVTPVKMLCGERHRERVLTYDEEARYLKKVAEPLASVAAVLWDTGLGPEECFRLRWEFVNWNSGRYGTLLVTHGKTHARRRLLPVTQRVWAILQFRWESQGKPSEGWLWPANTRSGHIEPSSLKWQHRKALKLSGVRPFVFYSLRHTFLTRLGESGCDAWTLARIAGHSSIAMSVRYVHPSEVAVHKAMKRLGGHKTRHTRLIEKSPGAERSGKSTFEVKGVGGRGGGI